MEALFENRYYSDKKMLSEFARRYSVGPTPKTTLLTLPLVVLCLPVLFLETASPESKWILWTCVAVMIATQFLPQLYGASTIKNMKHQNDGVLPETVIEFSEDNIQMFEGMVHLTIEYRKIVKTVRLKRSYALMTGKRTAVLVREDGFSKGTFQQFKAFLREKCPGVEIVE